MAARGSAAAAMSKADAIWIEAHHRARGSLRAFVRLAWPLLNPRTPFVPGWHIDAICEHLEAVTRAQLHRVLFCVPPAYSKSTLVSQCWPVWEWLQFPEHRFGFAAYGQVLTVRDSVKRRMLLESAWYRESFAPPWMLDPENRNKTAFKNTEQGEMVAASVGGPVTGNHYDRLIFDDLSKAGDVYNVNLAAAWTWYVEAWESRKRDGAAEVGVAQRLDRADVPGRLIESGGWEVVNLPERYVRTTRRTSIGWSDPRTVEGELLNPARFDEARVTEIWARLGSRMVAAQRQQAPDADGGTVFKRHWWKFYDALPACDAYLGSWDLTFGEGKRADYVVGQVWGRKGDRCYLLDQHREQLGFVDTEAAILALAAKWPQCRRWLVELAANGHGIVDVLRRKGLNVIGVKPTEGKVARAEFVSPDVERGCVWLPSAALAPWVLGFVHELCAFPTGDHDDQVDACTQALRELTARPAPVAWPTRSADSGRSPVADHLGDR